MPYTESELLYWITEAESLASEKIDERKEARKYYENIQAPDYVPTKMTYVVENLVTDIVDSLVGQMIGGEITVEMSGAGEMSEPLKELVMDYLERNKFNERCREPLVNRFYVEGKPSIEVYYNPRRKSPYGIGIPEINITKSEKTWLDPNSEGWFHEDDQYRIKPLRLLKTYAEKKWPGKDIDVEPGNVAEGSMEYAEIFLIEFYDWVFEKDEKTKEIYEYKQYWLVHAQKSRLLEEPKPTGVNRFSRIIPAIYQPREEATKEPGGMVHRIKQRQDMLNSAGTILYEVVKAEVKNFLYTVGATEPEVKETKDQISKTNGYVNYQKLTDIGYIQKAGLAIALLQHYEMQQQSIKNISGVHDPERGVSETELSGRAIGFLQAKGKVPEITRKTHLELSLTEMVYVLLEIASNKMSEQPFSIIRKLDGKKRDIYFNTLQKDVPDVTPDKYNILDRETGMFNYLTKVDTDSIDLTVQIVMDSAEHENQEANKALVTMDKGILSRKDGTKKLYPKNWQEYYDNRPKENEAMAIVEKMMDDPELIQAASQGMQQLEATKQKMQGGGGENQPADS